MKILMIEDDPETAAYVGQGLREESHIFETVQDGSAGLRRAASEMWDLLIVDRRLPSLDGLALVQRLRAAEIFTPVLFLTTMGGIDDRVAGLNAGGDDYLAKPFAFTELLARIGALARRARLAASVTRLRVADLEIDLLTRAVHRGGEAIELQPREFQLLEYLVRNTGHIVTRKMLLEAVWDFHFDPQTNIVESHISRLRSKINLGRPELIHTVRGAGYRVSAHG